MLHRKIQKFSTTLYGVKLCHMITVILAMSTSRQAVLEKCNCTFFWTWTKQFGWVPRDKLWQAERYDMIF